MSGNEDSESSDGDRFHVEGSRVAHHSRDCQHLDKAKDENIEPIDEEEAESYRTCHQCAIDKLSPAEKRRRWEKSRRRTKTTVKIRR